MIKYFNTDLERAQHYFDGAQKEFKEMLSCLDHSPTLSFTTTKAGIKIKIDLEFVDE